MIDDFIRSVQINKYAFSKAGSAEYVLNTYMNNSGSVALIKSDFKLLFHQLHRFTSVFGLNFYKVDTISKFTQIELGLVNAFFSS